jgi:hypothetical protein
MLDRILGNLSSFSSYIYELGQINRHYSLKPLNAGIIDIAEPWHLALAASMSTTSSQHHLISLAKQGNPKALTTLINQTLSPLGVVVTSALNAECLVVTAIVPDTIDRKFLIEFMREGMERLQANSIRQVLLVGRDRARVTPDWQYILNLYQADLPPAAIKRKRQQVIERVAPAPEAKVRPPARSRPWLMNRTGNWVLTLFTITLLVGGGFAAKVVFLVDRTLDRRLDFAQEVEQLTSHTAITSIDKLATASVGHLQGLSETWCASSQGWEAVLAKAISLGLLERKLLPEDRQELWIVAQPNRKFQMTPRVDGNAPQFCVQPLN